MFILGFVLGTVLGSFIKALADRSLIKSSVLGRSYCPHCKVRLQWYDLFPIFSYILLRGKCRYCRKKIGVEYLLVEVAMGILIGFLFWQSFNSLQFTVNSLQSFFRPEGLAYYFKFLILNFQNIIILFDLLFKTFSISVLVALFLTDLKKMLIPDRIVLPAIMIALIYIVVITLVKIGYLYYYLRHTSLGQALLSNTDYFQRHAFYTAEPSIYAVLVSLALALFFLSLIIVTRGKGMGGGDVRLAAFLGIILGFPGAVLATMLAFLSGALVSLVLIFTGKKHFGQVIPFGPFLVFGSLVALFWGNQIIDWYLRLGR